MDVAEQQKDPLAAGPAAWPKLHQYLASADSQLLRDWQMRQEKLATSLATPLTYQAKSMKIPSNVEVSNVNIPSDERPSVSANPAYAQDGAAVADSFSKNLQGGGDVQTINNVLQSPLQTTTTTGHHALSDISRSARPSKLTSGDKMASAVSRRPPNEQTVSALREEPASPLHEHGPSMALSSGNDPKTLVTEKSDSSVRVPRGKHQVEVDSDPSAEPQASLEKSQAGGGCTSAVVHDEKPIKPLGGKGTVTFIVKTYNVLPRSKAHVLLSEYKHTFDYKHARL